MQEISSLTVKCTDSCGMLDTAKEQRKRKKGNRNFKEICNSKKIIIEKGIKPLILLSAVLE